MKTRNISDLQMGQSARIGDITCAAPLKRRLADLGLIMGTPVTCVHISPYGSPIAFQIRGAVIALRRQDCQQISLIG